MAVLWTSSGKKTTTARAVGSAPVKVGQNVLWDPAEHGGKQEPDASDVQANGWPEGTIIYRLTSG